MVVNRPRLSVLIIAVNLTVGGWQFGQGVYIYAKAELAQYLLASAWEESKKTHQPIKPWPWADTWPIARLQVPTHNVDLIVLAGDSGRQLCHRPARESCGGPAPRPVHRG